MHFSLFAPVFCCCYIFGNILAAHLHVSMNIAAAAAVEFTTAVRSTDPHKFASPSSQPASQPVHSVPVVWHANPNYINIPLNESLFSPFSAVRLIQGSVTSPPRARAFLRPIWLAGRSALLHWIYRGREFIGAEWLHLNAPPSRHCHGPLAGQILYCRRPAATQ